MTVIHTGPAAHVRAMTPTDWPAVRAIHTEGINTGHATFEAEPPDWEHFNASKLPGHRHVADAAGQVIGWVAATAVSARPVYAGVVEHSVYVSAAARGQGVGTALLDALIASTEAAGIWIIVTRQRIALMTYGPLVGQWRDVLLIERRSQRVHP